MPTTTIAVTSQVMEIDEITDIAVTSIAHDDAAGDYYREIVFFGTPPDAVEGIEFDVSTIPTILRLKIRAPTVAPLKITVPQDEF
jgi:hypothetical protein